MSKKRRKKPPVRKTTNSSSNNVSNDANNANQSSKETKVVKTVKTVKTTQANTNNTNESQPKAKVQRESRTTRTTRSTANRKRPTSPKARPAKKSRETRYYSAKDLLFDRSHYTFMIAGLGLIIIGMLLMNGGAMPDANTWDEGRIYSFTRITLAPIIILIGLGMQIFAIFRKGNHDSEEVVNPIAEEANVAAEGNETAEA